MQRACRGHAEDMRVGAENYVVESSAFRERGGLSAARRQLAAWDNTTKLAWKVEGGRWKVEGGGWKCRVKASRTARRSRVRIPYKAHNSSTPNTSEMMEEVFWAAGAYCCLMKPFRQREPLLQSNLMRSMPRKSGRLAL
jgi:hypothetical protein